MLKLKNLFFHLLSIFLIAGFILAIRFKPITTTFEFDYDEGLNLIKTLLYSKGLSLYTQIWNDQPPLFTVILSYWFRVFGQSVVAARFLILLFSATLLWCFYQIVRRDLGTIPAVLATLLLFSSWVYIRLSMSVMIGIPSIALAMLSIYFLRLYKENHQKYLMILSGIFLAISLQTKLFTSFLAPLMFFDIFNWRWREICLNQKQGRDQYCSVERKQETGFLGETRFLRPGRDWFYTLVCWLGSFGIIYIVVGLLFQQFFHYDQIVQSHLEQPIRKGELFFNNIGYVSYILAQDYDYIFLGCVGFLVVLFKKLRSGLFPLSWFVASAFILLNHKPIWYHYYLLLSIPTCWLAAYGIAFLLDSIPKGLKSWNIKMLICPCVVVILFIVLAIATPTSPKGTPPKDLEVSKLIFKYKNSTQWVFTDRPMYAFNADLRVPPEIAVMSYKRLNSGNLTSKELLAVLQNYHPEQIVLDRWAAQIKSDRQLMAYINQKYLKIYTNEKGTVEHYI
ncbi:MAG: glycosyltransferase family 39 protein, partial [Scytonema sp. PMC 1069.18]|nr:glycosyltransferase family 39 protein [Scytonema sp. PMC 1069.18]